MGLSELMSWTLRECTTDGLIFKPEMIYLLALYLVLLSINIVCTVHDSSDLFVVSVAG